MLRRSAGRLSRHLAATLAAQAEAVGAEAGGRVSAVPALQLYTHWQQGGSSSGAGAGGGRIDMAVRHFSFGASKPQQESQRSEALPSDDAADDGAAELASGAPDASSAAAAASAATAAEGGVSDDFTPGNILQAAALAEEAALEAAAEDAWAPTRALQHLLSFARSSMGAEDWWSPIAATTVAVRAAMLPLAVMQIKNTYKLSQARPEIEKLLEHLKQEQARGNPNATSEYQQRVAAVWAKYGANPLKSLAGIFVQAPIFIGFFSALRSFASHKVPSFTEGGALWFTDLSVHDPYYALPVLAGLTFLVTVELGAIDGMQGQPEAVQRRTKNVMRLVALGIIPLTLKMPAGVFAYWITSNMVSLFQTAALKSKGLKRLLGLPDIAKANVSKQQEMVGKPVVTYVHKPQKKAAAGPKQ